jgi:hypothetical protein
MEEICEIDKIHTAVFHALNVIRVYRVRIPIIELDMSLHKVRNANI